MSDKDKSGLGYGDQIHEGVLSYENEVLESVFDSRSSDVEDSPVYDRFVKVKGMHAVPPLMTGIYMPPKSNFGIDESNFIYGPKQSKTSESAANTSDSVSCESNSSVETLESVPKPAIIEPKAVSKPKVWSDAPIIEYQATTTSAAKKVNTTRTIVKEIRPRNNFYKSHSPIRKPFNRTTTLKANFTSHKINTDRDKTVSAIRGNRETAVKALAGMGSTSGIRACALRNFDLEVMELENTQNNALAKLPILKLEEYRMWEIRIKQYFQIQDYAL
ncbi:hypothetical protein Tco_1294014 [Tanacetum coccineum]